MVSAEFFPRRIERLAGRVGEIMAGLLAELAGTVAVGEEIDLLSRYAFPLPMTVISEVIGIPESRRVDFPAVEWHSDGRVLLR